METFFRADFADVRIHVGPEAARIGAIAFARGTDLHFAEGHYDPISTEGQKLLAHELTHVLQQRAGRAAVLARESLPFIMARQPWPMNARARPTLKRPPIRLLTARAWRPKIPRRRPPIRP